jgi:aldose sugar dehydrogenase
MTMPLRRRDLLLSALAAPFILRSRSARAAAFPSSAGKLRVDTVAGGLDHPWGLAFLPGGGFLVSERGGALRRIGADGRLFPPLKGLPAVAARGQGGLLDIALHPDFSRNGLVYFTYAEPGPGGQGPGSQGTAAARGRFDGDGLSGVEVIFRMARKTGAAHHFGSRLAFASGGKLFITTGDRGEGQRAQDLGDSAGKVLRLADDGSIPGDNPFIGRAGALGEIWSYGHRNLQGAAIHPVSGALWTTEHGAMGGDEINAPKAGRNYGWPVITYGVDYSGAKIGEGTAKPGMEQPIHYWDPSIAPSGAAFYRGGMFPAWRDHLLVGSLKFGLLVRLRLEGEKVVEEERLLSGLDQRARDVRVGPDGAIYLLTDHAGGMLARVTPG